MRHSYMTHHLTLSQHSDVADRLNNTHWAHVYLARLGASPRKKEGDLGGLMYYCYFENMCVMKLW
jgi:hypothetical protein